MMRLGIYLMAMGHLLAAVAFAFAGGSAVALADTIFQELLGICLLIVAAVATLGIPAWMAVDFLLLIVQRREHDQSD